MAGPTRLELGRTTNSISLKDSALLAQRVVREALGMTFDFGLVESFSVCFDVL